MGWWKSELSLTILGDRAMARLNRETFGCRGPTNVIAFPVDAGDLGGGGRGPQAREPSSPKPPPPTPYGGDLRQGKRGPATPTGPLPMLGEVVISVETTLRQAAESGWPWEELFDFFLIHGILHLLGYDHGTPQEEARMDDKTWELLYLLHPKLKRGEE